MKPRSFIWNYHTLKNYCLMHAIWFEANFICCHVGYSVKGRPWSFHEFEAPRIQNNQHMNLVSLSTPRKDCLYPPSKYSWHSFLLEPESGQYCGRIMSMKNSNDTIGNRSRDLPVCSAVPQPTAPPRCCSVGICNTVCDPCMECYVLPVTLENLTGG